MTAARIVLGTAEGASNCELRAKLGCRQATVSQWRKRLAHARDLADAGAGGEFGLPRPWISMWTIVSCPANAEPL